MHSRRNKRRTKRNLKTPRRSARKKERLPLLLLLQYKMLLPLLRTKENSKIKLLIYKRAWLHLMSKLLPREQKLRRSSQTIHPWSPSTRNKPLLLKQTWLMPRPQNRVHKRSPESCKLEIKKSIHCSPDQLSPPPKRPSWKES